MDKGCVVEDRVTADCLLEEQGAEEYSAVLQPSFLDDYKNKLLDYRRIVASTGTKLTNLQRLTEEVFLKIGEKLPGMSERLGNTENEAEHLLDYFKKESGLLNNSTKESTSDLSKLNRASSYLIAVVGDQGDAFLQMSDMMRRIDNIKNSIESVRDFSVEMETLSINAAIVAIKAGDSGRSLNPITVELNKMANAAISLIDEIVHTSEQLADKYSLFQELSEQQATSCRSDVEKTSEHLALRYKTLQDSIAGLVEHLGQILSVVKQSKGPVGSIMNELQIQDILKQCTDHVRISLEEAGADETVLLGDSTLTGAQPEHLLDAIEFQEKVPLLCIQLLDDIDSRLEDSLKSLAGELNSIGDLMKRVTACQSGETVAASLDTTSLNDIEESFKGVEGVVMQTAVMIQNAANSWEQLWSTAVGLETMLETLEEQFRRLKKLTNFHLINIPIKIEVARSSDLSKDGGLSQRVEGLADYISTEMKRSHKSIVQDYQFLSQMVVSMGEHKKDVEANLESIALDIDDLLSNFFKAKEQVKTTFAHVCEEILALTELIQASLCDLGRIRQLIDQNKEVKHDLKQLADIASNVRESMLSVIGTVDWEIKDSRLKHIVDRFTVLAHKKIAEGLYDINVEDGNREGELILF